MTRGCGSDCEDGTGWNCYLWSVPVTTAPRMRWQIAWRLARFVMHTGQPKDDIDCIIKMLGITDDWKSKPRTVYLALAAGCLFTRMKISP